jgi:hypothetical protein
VSLRPLALAALAALACTSTEPPPAPGPTLVEPAPTPVVPVEPAPPSAPLPVSTQPWVWYHSYPELLVDAFSQVGTGSVAYEHRVGDRRRYVVRRNDQGVDLALEHLPEPEAVGEPVLVWRRRVTTTPIVGEPVVQAVMSRDVQIAVALRIPGGYERHTLAEDGSPVDSAIVLDPPGFDPQGAAIQLGGTSEHPMAYVRGTERAYLDELDHDTGVPVARASFGAEVLHDAFAWPPKGTRGERLGHCWPTLGGCHEVRRRGEVLELRAYDTAPSGDERWHTMLDPKGGRWWNMAVVIEHGEQLAVVAYHGSASGAAAWVIDRERGTPRFSGSPGSIGNIGHSKYGNEIALSLGDDGLVRAHGHESGGDYLGVLDLEAGRLLGHEVWRQ